MPVDQDMTYTKPTISTSGKKFKEVSNGFVMYNKYEAIFSGYLKMKEGVVNEAETLLTLPFKPKYPNAYLSAKLNSTVMTMYVDKDGNLKKQTQSTLDEDDYIFLVGSFPISTGGGFLTSFIKALRTFFQKENVKEVTYA